MAITPTKTTFQTGPETQVAKVDIYSGATNIKSSGPINVDPKINNLSSDSNKLSRLQPLNNKNKHKLFSSFKNRTFEKTKTLDSVLGSVRTFVHDPKQFKKNLKTDIGRGLLNAAGFKGNTESVLGWIDNPPSKRDILNTLGDNIPDVKVLINGIDTVRSLKDVNSATELLNAIGTITGNTDLARILDIGPQLAVAQKFIDTAFAYRIPEIAQLIEDTIELREDKKRLRIATTLNAAIHSEVDYIDTQILDPDIGVGPIMARYPELTSAIMEHYDYRPGQDIVTKEDSDKLISVIDKLKPDWHKDTRNGEEIETFVPIRNASTAAVEALMRNPDFYVLVMLSKEYPEVKLAEHTLSLRPYTPVEILKVELPA